MGATHGRSASPASSPAREASSSNGSDANTVRAAAGRSRTRTAAVAARNWLRTTPSIGWMVPSTVAVPVRASLRSVSTTTAVRPATSPTPWGV